VLEPFPSDWLGLLVDRELTHRRDKRLAARLRYARLRQQASIEDVDYRAPRGLDRALVDATDDPLPRPPRRTLDVDAALLCRQQMPAAVNVQWQIAVAIRRFRAPWAGIQPQKSGVGIGPDAKVREISACERQAR
jgi:hypothetical protein